MLKFLVILNIFFSAALAGEATLNIFPAANLERGLTVVQGRMTEFRVTPNVPDLQTVTLNITRGGRVMGEYAMRREGTEFVAKFGFEFPYAHIATLRLYQAKRVLTSAFDLSVLESTDAKLVPMSSKVSQPIVFAATEGKAGGDASPLYGLLALVVLGLAVFLGTRNNKKVMPNA